MRAGGLTADPWQADLLRSTAKRILLLASRQSGKSQTVAARVLNQAITKPNQFILLLSHNLRQSGELFREKLLPLWVAAGSPLKLKNATQLELRLSNGSRILSLPANEAGVRGFSKVNTLVIDEAARVDDLLYRSLRPMLAVMDGDIIAMTTPFGQRGWFYESWQSDQSWHRVKVTADQCPRLKPEFLAEERETLGDVFYKQEYLCLFGAVVGALWPSERFPDSIWFDQYPEGRHVHPVRRVMAVDTSRGLTELSDFQAFVLVTQYTNGSFWVEAELVRLDDLALYEKAVKLIEKWKPDTTVVEVAHAGYVLFNQLKRAGYNRLGRKRSGAERKFDRIARTLTQFWGRGDIHVKKSRGGKILIDQAMVFPIADYFDDAVDSLEMGIELILQLNLPSGHGLKTIRYES